MFTQTLYRIPIFVIGRCSLEPTSHWLHGKCARINNTMVVNNLELISPDRRDSRKDLVYLDVLTRSAPLFLFLKVQTSS
jgi:hypothetical protein